MSANMKVLWMSHSGIGLSETFLAETVSSLSSLSDVVCLSGAKRPSEEDSRLKVRSTGFMSPGYGPRRLLSRLMRGQDAWIGSVQHECLRRCLALVESNPPQIAWIDYATSAVFARSLMERLRIPYVVAVHGYDVTTSMRSPTYRHEFERTVSNGAAATVCASHHMQRLCVLAGVPAEKTVVIRLAVDADRIHRDESIPKTLNPSFVHLGRLVEQKGPLITLEAFELVVREIPNATLTYIGEGVLRAELERRIASKNLGGHVRLLGALPSRDALRAMQSHWVFCQHSVTGLDGSQEGFAISPAEAACMELPVIATWHNGIPEHVLDGETGFLVREYDYEAMALRMIGLARDSALRQRLGQAGRLNIRNLCDPSKRRAAIAELLAKIVPARHRPLPGRRANTPS